MKVDFLIRKHNRNKEKMMAGACWCLRLELPETVTLAEACEAAIKAGASKGTFQCGIVEVQSDKGIWAREDGMSLFYGGDKAIFKTWEQLDQEYDEEEPSDADIEEALKDQGDI